MTGHTTIFLVDDDREVRKSLSRALQHNSYLVDAYNSGHEFLSRVDLNNYGCIILDVAMPGMSGLEVQTELSIRDCRMPIIFMTGHGDVPTSVRALKSGAIEFLEKPFSMDVLLKRVEEAFVSEQQRQTCDKITDETVQRFNSLTNREADVMQSLVAGRADKSNKEVARALNISYRTVEEYRSRIMLKMAARSITHLVELAKLCGAYRN
jgi:FixJ family two-component response regulator